MYFSYTDEFGNQLDDQIYAEEQVQDRPMVDEEQFYYNDDNIVLDEDEELLWLDNQIEENK